MTTACAKRTSAAASMERMRREPDKVFSLECLARSSASPLELMHALCFRMFSRISTPSTVSVSYSSMQLSNSICVVLLMWLVHKTAEEAAALLERREAKVRVAALCNVVERNWMHICRCNFLLCMFSVRRRHNL